MSMTRNASEEFLEEIIHGSLYTFVSPYVRKKIDEWFPDEIDPDTGLTKPNILKEAVESSINVFIMGAMFMIIRYEEQILDKLFGLARTAKTSIVAGGKDRYLAMKEKVKGLRGVKASNRYKKMGEDFQTRAALIQSVDNEMHNIVLARQTQYASTASYAPAAQMQDTAVQKERLYHEIGASKAAARLQLANFKMMSGTFTDKDKQTLKAIFKSIDPSATYSPDSFNIDRLNQISNFMFVTDSSGNLIGLTESMVNLCNGMGYHHKINSGAA